MYMECFVLQGDWVSFLYFKGNLCIVYLICGTATCQRLQVPAYWAMSEDKADAVVPHGEPCRLEMAY